MMGKANGWSYYTSCHPERSALQRRGVEGPRRLRSAPRFHAALHVVCGILRLRFHCRKSCALDDRGCGRNVEGFSGFDKIEAGAAGATRYAAAHFSFTIFRLMPRLDDRAPHQLRPLSFTPGIAPHSTGSVLVAFGNTRVICSAMIENGVPRWMKEQNVTGGWITAEYSMLPYSTTQRKARDIAKGRLDGRSVEIQRLIGRSLRAAVDLELLGQRTLCIDCDVLQADGGTRTAAITGGCVAVALACRKLVEASVLT